MDIKFIKMHGLGNDFIIVDARYEAFPDNETIRRMTDRRRGIGCDQVLVIAPSKNPDADLFLHIFNPDGSTAQACGNGTRCVARLFMDSTWTQQCVIETAAGLLHCGAAADYMVEVDMREPRLGWNEIPVAREVDTLNAGLSFGPVKDPVLVNMGNPHAVFFVDDIEAVDIAAIGSQVENDALFPERTNVEFAQILAPGKIRMRVWERGAGVTQACGSGACATLVAAVRRGLSARRAEIVLDGGSLFIEWREQDGHVLMTGPAVIVFEGVWKDMLPLPDMKN